MKKFFALCSLAVWPLGALVLYTVGNPFHCVIHQVFHVYCPGCGSGRALQALLHFRLVEAFRYNALVVPMLMFILYEHVEHVIRYSGMPLLPKLKCSVNSYALIIVFCTSFGIVRNINYVPFNLLAPPNNNMSKQGSPLCNQKKKSSTPVTLIHQYR